MGESAVGSEELRKERSSFRGTLERGAVRHALICIFWCPPLPRSAHCLGLVEAGGGAESGWEESAGDGGGVAASGQKGGTCRLLSRSRLSRLPPQPAARCGEAGPGQTGRSAHPSHWHLLLATSAHPAAADSSLGPATSSLPGPHSTTTGSLVLLVLVCKGLPHSAGSDPPGGRTDQAPLVTLKKPAQGSIPRPVQKSQGARG